MNPREVDLPHTDEKTIELTWSGSPWSLVGLSIINVILSILTLGIYSFWGKTEVRRRVWSSIRLNGEPLAYTGTGKELFLGLLLVLLVVLLPTLIIVTAAVLTLGPHDPRTAAVQLALYIAYFFLFGVAIYRARRYRLTRTLWRGIRGGMSGSALSYAWLSFWTALLIPITLGWIIPWRSNCLQRRLASETDFGSVPFTYKGGSAPLYAYFAGLWIGGIVIWVAAGAIILVALGPSFAAFAELSRAGLPARFSPQDVALMIGIAFAAFTLLSIISVWYQSRQFNLFMSYTGFDEARLYAKTTALGLVGLFISNFLIVLLSIGILRPVALARSARYFIERTSVQGRVDTVKIAQSQAALSKVGEGLAQAFDVDAF
jgi:uncharacterized membrane protein YjgN (DUF898 family)